MTLAERRRLTAVARAAAPADLYVAGGTLLNVYTGEIYRANVAIAGARIAYVFTSSRARLGTRWRCHAGDFALPARDRYPVIRLVSAVITRLEQRGIEDRDVHAALLDREEEWDVKRSRLLLGSRRRP